MRQFEQMKTMQHFVYVNFSNTAYDYKEHIQIYVIYPKKLYRNFQDKLKKKLYKPILRKFILHKIKCYFDYKIRV